MILENGGRSRVRQRKIFVVLLTICAACFYGVVHDQITARLCLEYFTVAHPPLFRVHSVTALAFSWGVAATFGIGVLFGIVLGAVSQSGKVPTPFSRLVLSVALLLATMALSAALAGMIGYWLFRAGGIVMPLTLASRIPAAHHNLFMAVWFAHIASYLVGLGGGGLLCYRVWRKRGRPRVLAVFPRSPGGMIRAGVLIAITAWAVWFRFRH